MREASLIEARYGVNLRRAGTSDVESPSAVTLSVALIDRQAHAWTTEPLGSITFVGGKPEPAIAMYPNAIAALVSTVEFTGRGPDAWPLLFHDRILGRVLGRALAHEIGHFLLATGTHAERGLMRARIDSREFAAMKGDAFRLDRDASRWLRQRLTSPNLAIPVSGAPGFSYAFRSTP